MSKSSQAVSIAVDLDDILLLDLGFDNWFWRERLRGNILFRNVLDRTVRFHPIGAAFDLSVYVQVEFVVGRAAALTVAVRLILRRIDTHHAADDDGHE